MADGRGSGGYELWHDHVRYVEDRQTRYYLREVSSLEDYLDRLRDVAGDYTLILSLNGNYRAQGDDVYLPYLTDMGIDVDSYENGGVWLIRSGDVLYYSQSAQKFQYYRELGDTDCNIYKDEDEEFPHIVVEDYDFYPTSNGISAVLFDETCDYVIDDMFVNIYDGTAVERLELDE